MIIPADPVTAIYWEDGTKYIHISPSKWWYPVVVLEYLLPYLDCDTTLTVSTSEDDYIPNDVVDVDFRMIQECPPLFAVTYCDDFHFLKYYMVKNNLVGNDAALDRVENYLWKQDQLYDIMMQERSNNVIITKDNCEKQIYLDDWNDGDMDPEVHTRIGHLGRGPGHIKNPLELLSLN
ncbi:hypothetical protein JTE90_017152 [Oedothorax gibbosus]|uniref:Uncharacterized protein n=1 Tax=Oedothorax gibbosus TaxID=931172 RepID=A0AAV6TL33_9ARAC|nr:hypothetical protein JTE90_017152 [Oedothorax gibbosus]